MHVNPNKVGFPDCQFLKWKDVPGTCQNGNGFYRLLIWLRKLTKDDGNENLEWTINYIIVNLEMELYL